MKHLRETFTDQEFAQLKEAKGKLNWYDFIMALTELDAFDLEATKEAVVSWKKKMEEVKTE